MTGEIAVRTEALTKFYGARRGIEDLGLEVAAGEVMGFLGPNGAGKTTTIRLLLDFLRPTRGTAVVLGLDPRRDKARLHRRIGYLPGELAFPGTGRADELLRFFAAARGGVDWSHVTDLAGRLELDLARPVRAMSKGNKQKVGLVQAFMHRPDLLVLDEPTSGLDPLMQQEFLAMVREARDAGQTVFMSSHVLAEVQEVADRVAIVRDGRLAAVQRVESLGRRAVRTVEVHFADPVDAAEFAVLPGVRDVDVSGPVLRCTVEGRLDPLVKAAARHEVIDLLSAEPDLEETFLSFYYHSEGTADAARADA
ncbi:ABC transporter ATP-binding protein [Dactylosporangium aurantiacum]|uniref:ABC transporter ATP-binding protein n=1 Tax=Dactylosporangium aurantiacum TaxID=35754 RepID=A0A9Q9IEP3_9ACTN|nr:ABC transporter ATP-binding protein [Dactylosporangium aurantiacum]MDG6107324.1 ABC transporter ATP-binding protein [Dactylosporangium aurantiacum]UWZ51150.1 ABC transporter ATP-binding protein [Dactylosporangium aurantiacum]